MAGEVATEPRPAAVRDLRDVLVAHQVTSPARTDSASVVVSNQQAESLAQDILALVQSEIDTQVEWRVRQAVDRLMAERPTQQVVDPQHQSTSAATSVTTMVLSIPIIAIAGGIGGFPGLFLALLALVVINLSWATGWTPGQRRR